MARRDDEVPAEALLASLVEQRAVTDQVGITRNLTVRVPLHTHALLREMSLHSGRSMQELMGPVVVHCIEAAFKRLPRNIQPGLAAAANKAVEEELAGLEGEESNADA